LPRQLETTQHSRRLTAFGGAHTGADAAGVAITTAGGGEGGSGGGSGGGGGGGGAAAAAAAVPSIQIRIRGGLCTIAINRTLVHTSGGNQRSITGVARELVRILSVAVRW
jgi:hypothetical protein